MRERERLKRTEERTHKESAGCDSLCMCVLRSYVFALETLALDEPGRERERDEEEMVIGVSSVADSFLFYTKSSSKFELILISFCILILELTSSRRTTSS